MRYIDLRSDTVTQPTEEMRKAMANAIVGDDVYQDDPTVIELENLAAKILGKEAGLFIPSGTMANQIAIMVHTKMGDEIILGANSHIVKHEVGAAARLSGVSYAIVDNPDDRIYKEDILNMIRDKDIHHPETGLICLENALANGTVIPIEEMKILYETARANKIPVHLDGARLFNAAISLGVEAKDLAKYTDSLMFCISKGLCSPVGSLLCGTRDFIERARRMRKLLGGGMRQAGILAASGLISLEKMVARLGIDHDNASYLAGKLSQFDIFSINLQDVHINMVFCDITDKDFDSDKFVKNLFDKGIKINGIEDGKLRFVTNNDIDKDDIDYTIKCISEIIKDIFS